MLSCKPERPYSTKNYEDNLKHGIRLWRHNFLKCPTLFTALLIASFLHKNIYGIPILIDRAPQILMLPVNRDHRFIEVPGITQLSLAFLESAGIGRTKFQAPASYRFIGHDDPAFREEFFDFTKTETEAVIQPDGVADDCRRESVPLVANGLSLHAIQCGKSELR